MSLPKSKEEVAQAREKILKKYIRAVKKHKRIPSEGELREVGLSRHAIRWQFKNPQALKLFAMEQHPEVFENIIDESLFTDEHMEELEQLVDGMRTAVVSTVVTGCKLHKGFHRAIKNFAAHNKATPLYIPVTDPASKAGWTVSEDLEKENIVVGDLALNSNVYINTIKMSAKQMDPTTSLERMGHKMSFIFGSPKQRLRVKPNANLKHPHVSMGTGAITLPDYATDRYMSERTATLAKADHKIGALIVELDADDRYYFRQVQAANSGAFADLGKLYLPDGKVVEYQPEFLVMGDLHPGETDPVALNCWKEVIKETGVRNIVIHDGVNGHSISHWLEGKIIEKALLAKKKMTNLEEEGRLCARYFREIMNWLPDDGKLFMVSSNHNDFIYRYLNDQRFVKDYENFAFVSQKVMPKVMDGEDPAKVLVELFLTPEERKRIVWWKEDEDFRYAGVQLSAHGDRGPNGSKGTIKNQEACYGACIVGHSHVPGIMGEAYQVGTTTFRQLSYTDGPSGWMQTSCLLYRNGSRQLINCIDGKWRLKRGSKKNLTKRA